MELWPLCGTAVSANRPLFAPRQAWRCLRMLMRSCSRLAKCLKKTGITTWSHAIANEWIWVRRFLHIIKSDHPEHTCQTQDQQAKSGPPCHFMQPPALKRCLLTWWEKIIVKNGEAIYTSDIFIPKRIYRQYSYPNSIIIEYKKRCVSSLPRTNYIHIGRQLQPVIKVIMTMAKNWS